jgi:hypothetical protein
VDNVRTDPQCSIVVRFECHSDVVVEHVRIDGSPHGANLSPRIASHPSQLQAGLTVSRQDRQQVLDGC